MICIIGAGPIGSYLGFLLAKQGKEVQIFEEHSIIGKPIQCTGLLTGEFGRIASAGTDFVINKLDTVRIFSPDKNSVDIKLGKKEFVVDRQLFDQHFANLATDSGAQVHLSCSFKGIKQNGIIIKEANTTRKLAPDIVVGADGVKSAVAKAAGLDKNRKYMVGMQARLKLPCEKNVYQVHFGSLFPNFFGWVVPESDNIVRIGLASHTNPEISFKKFLNTVAGPGWKKKMIESQGGLIPVYNPLAKTQAGNIFLVGDAACQIKNTTAGGIVPGLLAAEALCSSIINKKDYQQAWKDKIGSTLWLHYKLRKVLDNFSDKDYNKLIELCKKNNVQHVIKNESREFPAKLLLKIILKEPRLMSFGRYLI